MSTTGSRDCSLVSLARLGRVLSQPIRYFHRSHWQTPELDADLVESLARHDTFEAPLRKLILDCMPIEIAVPPNLVERLRADRETRIAAMITGASTDEFHESARLLSAAIMRRELCSLIARSDRERAIALYGRSAFQTGIREASALYGDLDSLTGGRQPDFLEFDGEWMPPALELGYSWLYGFVGMAEPVLAKIFHYRVPKEFSLPETECLSMRCRSQITKLFERKMPGWSSSCTA